MRKITDQAQKAFWDNGYFKLDNTTVLNGTMTLHRTMIASRCDGLLTLNSGGVSLQNNQRAIKWGIRTHGVSNPAT